VTEKEYFIIAMENVMMESGKVVILMVLEYTTTKMVIAMKVNLDKGKEKGAVFTFFQMEKSN